MGSDENLLIGENESEWHRICWRAASLRPEQTLEVAKAFVGAERLIDSTKWI
jgi:hypothetical protein